MGILILNHDASFLDKAKRYFLKRGYQIHLGDNGMDGLFYIVNYQPDVIITNVNLNMLSATELYRITKSKGKFMGKFFFVNEEGPDGELYFHNEKHRVYENKTAFSRILEQLR